MKLFGRRDNETDAETDREPQTDPADATGRPHLHLVESPDDDVQRREEVRTHVAMQIEIRNAYGNRVDKITTNLSAGGVLVSDAKDLDTGAMAPFVLDLRPEGPLIEGQAEVLRVDEDGRAALRFAGLEPKLRDEIARFVFSCERTRVRPKAPGE